MISPRFPGLFLIVTLLLVPALAGASALSSGKDMRVYGYLVSWALKMNMGSSNYETCPFSSIDWESCTDYIMFDAAFTSSGTLERAYDWATDDSSAWHYSYFEYTKRRLVNDTIHAHGKTIQLTFFESSSELATLTATPAVRATMIRTILDSVIGPANRYDGVHWDIEPMDVADTAALRSFLAEVRDSLDHYRQWANPLQPPLQTVAVYNYPSFWARVSPSLDAILHMSYDMFGSWESVTWFNAPLFLTGYESNNVASIAGYIDYYLAQGIPADKLVVACPFNYNAYQGGSTSGGEGVYAPGLTMLTFPTWTNTNNEMYCDAWTKWIDTATVTLHHDTAHVAAWIGINNPGSANDRLILFQDTLCVRQILEHISSSGIQGAMIWEICGAYIGSVNQTRHPGLASDHLLQAAKQTRLNLRTTEVAPSVGSSFPKTMSLAQNWPNPCNPSTCISYSIARSREYGVGSREKAVQVRLAVYDLLGREVTTIVNGYQTPGEHRVVFNGKDLSSGVYFYRLMAGGQMLSRKLILLR